MTPQDIRIVVCNCTYEPWLVTVNEDSPGGRLYVQVRDRNGKCNVSGKPKPWGGRKWFLSEHMTETEIVKTCLNAVIAAQTHETLETFKYRGYAIFDPHIRVTDLVVLRATKPLDARAEPEPKRALGDYGPMNWPRLPTTTEPYPGDWTP